MRKEYYQIILISLCVISLTSCGHSYEKVDRVVVSEMPRQAAVSFINKFKYRDKGLSRNAHVGGYAECDLKVDTFVSFVKWGIINYNFDVTIRYEDARVQLKRNKDSYYQVELKHNNEFKDDFCWVYGQVPLSDAEFENLATAFKALGISKIIEFN